MTFSSTNQMDFLVRPKNSFLQGKAPLLTNQSAEQVFKSIPREANYQIEQEQKKFFKTDGDSSSSNKNKSLTSNKLYNRNLFKSNQLTSIVKVVKKADLDTRLRWSEELIGKLYLIKTKFSAEACKITLDSIKVDSEGNLIIDMFERNAASVQDVCYRLPEEFFQQKVNNSKANIWSAGICIYYMNTLAFPWKKASVNDKSYRNFVEKHQFALKLETRVKRALLILLNVNNETRQPLKEAMKSMHERSFNRKVIS